MFWSGTYRKYLQNTKNFPSGLRNLRNISDVWFYFIGEHLKAPPMSLEISYIFTTSIVILQLLVKYLSCE